MLVCEKCGGTNIEEKRWVNPNTNEIGGTASDGEDDDNYCNDCQLHVGIIEEKNFKKSSEFPEFLEKIDWSLLREQKQTIIDIIDNGELNPRFFGHLNGMIELIDAIQDFATDVMGFTEKEVFDLDTEE